MMSVRTTPGMSQVHTPTLYRLSAYSGVQQSSCWEIPGPVGRTLFPSALRRRSFLGLCLGPQHRVSCYQNRSEAVKPVAQKTPENQGITGRIRPEGLRDRMESPRAAQRDRPLGSDNSGLPDLIVPLDCLVGLYQYCRLRFERLAAACAPPTDGLASLFGCSTPAGFRAPSSSRMRSPRSRPRIRHVLQAPQKRQAATRTNLTLSIRSPLRRFLGPTASIRGRSVRSRFHPIHTPAKCASPRHRVGAGGS